MRTALFLCVLGAIGCSVAAGKQGEKGDPAKVNVVWRDATGAYVSDDSLVYIDGQQRVWHIDAETAQPAAMQNVELVWFESTDCSGPGYITPLPPREPFVLPGETAYRVRPDTLQPVLVHVRSANWQTCTSTNQSAKFLPVDARTVPDAPIVLPSLSFAAPLHRESPNGP